MILKNESTMWFLRRKRTPTHWKNKKNCCEKGEKKVKIFQNYFLLCSFSLSLSIFTIFLSLDSAFEEAATLFSRSLSVSLWRILSTEEERAREWVLFLTETRLFTYLLGWRTTTKKKRFFSHLFEEDEWTRKRKRTGDVCALLLFFFFFFFFSWIFSSRPPPFGRWKGRRKAGTTAVWLPVLFRW